MGVAHEALDRLVTDPDALGHRDLPKDARGYPIPVTALTTPDGKRDFRVIDSQVSHRCFTLGLCGVCGQPMGRHRAFVGGPRSALARMYTDVWVHRACGEYALKVFELKLKAHFDAPVPAFPAIKATKVEPKAPVKVGWPVKPKLPPKKLKK